MFPTFYFELHNIFLKSSIAKHNTQILKKNIVVNNLHQQAKYADIPQ